MSKRITELPAVSAVAGTDLLALAQSTVTRKVTLTQLAESSIFASLAKQELRFGAADLSNANRFLNWGGSSGHVLSTIEANGAVLIYRAGTIRAGYAKRLGGSFNHPGTVGFTLRKGTETRWDGSANTGDMADTAMVITASSSAVEAENITDTIAVAKGDLLSVRNNDTDTFSAWVVVLVFEPGSA